MENIETLKENQIYTYDIETREVKIVDMFGVETNGKKLYKIGDNIYPIGEEKDEKGKAFCFSLLEKRPHVFQLTFNYFISNDYVKGEVPFFFSKENLLDFDAYVCKKRPLRDHELKTVYQIVNDYEYGIYIIDRETKDVDPKKVFIYPTFDVAKNVFNLLLYGLRNFYNEKITNTEIEIETLKDEMKGIKTQYCIVNSFKKGHTYTVIDITKDYNTFTVSNVDENGVVYTTDNKIYAPKMHEDAVIFDLTSNHNNAKLSNSELISLYNKFFEMKHHIDFLRGNKTSAKNALKKVRGHFGRGVTPVKLRETHVVDDLLTKIGGNLQ
jgi:hypothetical protein